MDGANSTVGLRGAFFMKAFAIGLAAATLVWSAPCFAEEIDLSTWTCAQFQSASKDDVGVILAWLDGYSKDEADPPVIDSSQFAANAKKLGDYCTVHPNVELIT